MEKTIDFNEFDVIFNSREQNELISLQYKILIWYGCYLLPCKTIDLN